MTVNGKVSHELASSTTFTCRGHEFSLSLRDAFFALEEIRTSLPPTATTKDYLKSVAAWVQEATGVDLTPGEADELSDHIAVAYNEAKKKRHDAIDSMWKSRSATGSTPSD